MKTLLFLLLIIPSLSWGLTFKDGKQVENNKSNTISKNSYVEIILPDDVGHQDWIDLEILEFCKSSEDILIAHKSKDREGVWETYTFPIKKDENITLHQTIDGIDEIYISEKFETFFKKNNDFVGKHGFVGKTFIFEIKSRIYSKQNVTNQTPELGNTKYES